MPKSKNRILLTLFLLALAVAVIFTVFQFVSMQSNADKALQTSPEYIDDPIPPASKSNTIVMAPPRPMDIEPLSESESESIPNDDFFPCEADDISKNLAKLEPEITQISFDQQLAEYSDPVRIVIEPLDQDTFGNPTYRKRIFSLLSEGITGYPLKEETLSLDEVTEILTTLARHKPNFVQLRKSYFSEGDEVSIDTIEYNGKLLRADGVLWGKSVFCRF